MTSFEELWDRYAEEGALAIADDAPEVFRHDIPDRIYEEAV